MLMRLFFKLFNFPFIILPIISLSVSVAVGAEHRVLGKGPVVITSERLSADNRANTALFEGSVVARTEEITLYADHMLVFYSEKGDVEKIEAGGAVRLVKGNQVLTAGKALYLAAKQEVIFTENPKAVKGGSVVTGARIIYLIDEDRSIVENSKVFLERAE